MQTARGRRPLYISRDAKGLGVVFQAHSGSGFSAATGDTSPNAGMALAAGSGSCGSADGTGAFSCTMTIAGVPAGFDDFRFTLWSAAPGSCAANNTGCSFSGAQALSVYVLNDYAALEGQNNTIPGGAVSVTLDPVVDSVDVFLSSGIVNGSASTLTATTVFKDAAGDIIATGDQLLDKNGNDLTVSLGVANNLPAACTPVGATPTCSLNFGSNSTAPSISHANDAAALSTTITYDGTQNFPTSASLPAVTVSLGTGSINGSNAAGTLAVTNSSSSFGPFGAAPAITKYTGARKPVGLVVDSAGDVFAADTNGNIVEVSYPLYSVSSSNLGGALTAAGPQSLAFAANGLLFIGPSSSNEILYTNPPSYSDGALTSSALNATADPQGLITGPDGNVWFGEGAANDVGEITANGIVTEYPSGVQSPIGLAASSDGNIWYTGSANDTVGYMDPVSHSAATISLTASSGPQQIAAGSDGELYVTENTSGKIAKIDPSGHSLTWEKSAGTASPQFIVSGPDGNLWYTDPSNNEICAMSTAGAVVKCFSTGTDQPEGIVSNAVDGKIYFAGKADGTINSFTP